MLKTIISLSFFLTAATALAQDDCTLYQKSNKNIEQYKKEIEQSKNKFAKGNLQEKVKNESAKAAIFLESCTTSNPSTESRETLSRWYKIAKLFMDDQMFSDAIPFLERCKNQPESHSYFINGNSLNQLADKILTRCEKVKIDAGGVLHLDIMYEGKSTYFLEIIPMNYEELED